MSIRMLLIFLIICFQVTNTKEQHVNYYGIVLAGGVGERLWPLSRRDNPKQFLSVDSQKTLLDQSIERLALTIPPENLWLVISQQHCHQLSASMKVGNVLIESNGRNTGPAILFACLELYKKDPNAVVIFVPADPYIPASDYALFAKYVQQSLDFVAQHDVIGLLGVKPTYPATGYGYIEFNENRNKKGLYKVERFHEKPSSKLASFYVQMPHMLWNIGMFAGKVSVFIDEFQRTAPDLYNEVIAWQTGEKKYDEITNISIDYALMERSDRAWVLPVDFSWCDVGNVDVFLTIKRTLQKNLNSVIEVNSKNSLVDVPSKLVALVGVDDLCVIETDDALLIVKRSEAEKVRNVVAKLKETNQTSYL